MRFSRQHRWPRMPCRLLLTGPGSVALNRAAMVSPELAALLLRSGRHRIGPLVERYLARLDAAGHLHARRTRS